MEEMSGAFGDSCLKHECNPIPLPQPVRITSQAEGGVLQAHCPHHSLMSRGSRSWAPCARVMCGRYWGPRGGTCPISEVWESSGGATQCPKW